MDQPEKTAPTPPPGETSLVSKPPQSRILHIVIGVITGMLLIGGGYAFYDLYYSKDSPDYKVNKETKTATESAKKEKTPPPPVVDETANWETYTNVEHKFSFKHPSDWVRSSGVSADTFSKGNSKLTFMWADPGIQETREKTEMVKTQVKEVLFEFVTFSSGNKVVFSNYTISEDKLKVNLVRGDSKPNNNFTNTFNTIIFETPPNNFETGWIEAKKIIATFKFLD